jgi:hypothetical protein
MGGIVVYTSIVNHHDYLRPPLLWDHGARYICFSDLPMAPCPPWEIQPCPIVSDSPTRNSRVPKFVPHLLFDAEYSIYHDGYFSLRRLAGDLVRHRLTNPGCDIAMFSHPARDCIYDEGREVLEMSAEAVRRGYPPTPDPTGIVEQMERYRDLGHPPHWGLWAGGFIVRRHTDMMARLGEEWMQEYMAGGERDQLPFPVVLRRLCCRINSIAGQITDNADMAFDYPAEFVNRGDHSEREPERQRLLAKAARIRELARGAAHARALAERP